MDTSTNNLSSLFDQLGLPSTAQEIQSFVDGHRPLPPTLHLHQAGWWSPSQAQFLKQSIEEDAEWAEAVDELDTMLR
jgi:hypothetical protein